MHNAQHLTELIHRLIRVYYLLPIPAINTNLNIFATFPTLIASHKHAANCSYCQYRVQYLWGISVRFHIYCICSVKTNPLIILAECAIDPIYLGFYHQSKRNLHYASMLTLRLTILLQTLYCCCFVVENIHLGAKSAINKLKQVTVILMLKNPAE